MKVVADRRGGQSVALDDIDRSMLRLLRANARISQEKLGGSVNLSRSALHDRLRRLEEQGVIRAYRAVVEWSALGLPNSALVWMRLAPGSGSSTIANAVLALTSQDATVEECHGVTGEWAMAAVVHAASPAALQAITDRIGKVTGIQQTMTQIILSSAFSS